MYHISDSRVGEEEDPETREILLKIHCLVLSFGGRQEVFFQDQPLHTPEWDKLQEGLNYMDFIHSYNIFSLTHVE